jgi:hypothetical protein
MHHLGLTAVYELLTEAVYAQHVLYSRSVVAAIVLLPTAQELSFRQDDDRQQGDLTVLAAELPSR